MKPITIINGPNLNLLGLREPEIYGSETLADVQSQCESLAAELGVGIRFHQSNHEGAIVDLIQDARQTCSGIILNPAGFTTTSVAILDALLASNLPIVEVHISNIHRRERFRQRSLISTAADAVIAGAGTHGYQLALRHLAALV